MKPLAIAIPTYNRAAKVISQLGFLLEETRAYRDEVAIYVFDNHSTDTTEQELRALEKSTPGFRYIRNERNLGLVGNILRVIDSCMENHLWMVGDDDRLHPGIFREIRPHLGKQVGLIHLNHACRSGFDGSTVHEQFYAGDFRGLSGQPLIAKLLENQHTGAFMFLTANIINTCTARTIISSQSEKDRAMLAFPLYLNLSLALRDNLAFVQKPTIDCIYFTTSWKDHAQEVLRLQMPYFLSKLSTEGLPRSLAATQIVRQLSHELNPFRTPIWVSLRFPRAVLAYARFRIKALVKVALRR